MDVRKLVFGTLAASLAVLPGPRADAQTVVNTNVTADTTWSGVIVLARPIFVNSGATLTINPGTIVRGQPRTGAVSPGNTNGTPGALIVTQSGTIIANGTANNPIIMTTAATDNDADGVADDAEGGGPNGFRDPWDPGDLFLDATPTTAPLAPLDAAGNQNVALWGGLVILGSASTNLADPCGTGQGTCTVEGLAVPGFPVSDCKFGGTDDADSSGSLSFLSVRHAGDEIGNSNELNGVTLAGVGSGTEFRYIDIYTNFDDGIEWFGGTVNGDHLNVSYVGDDSFDADQGYRGTNQFLSTEMAFFNAAGPATYGTVSGDKACEFDGDDWNEPQPPDRVNFVDVGPAPGPNCDGVGSCFKPSPFPNSTWWNMTIAGSAQPATFNGFTNDNRGCQMRNGFAGTVHNVIVTRTGTGGAGGTRQGFDDAGAGADVAPAGTANGDFRTPANAAAGLIHVHDVTCNEVTAIPVANPDTAEENELRSGDSVPEANDLGFGSGNETFGCIDGVTPGDYGLVAETTSFTPTGVSGKLNSSLGTIDLRPATLSAAETGSAPPASLDETATYRGAFPPSPAGMWIQNWTALGQAGMLPEPGSTSTLAAGALLLMLLKRRR